MLVARLFQIFQLIPPLSKLLFPVIKIATPERSERSQFISEFGELNNFGHSKTQ